MLFAAISAIKDIYNTMKYLHETILSNLYPGAPYEREVRTLGIFCIVLIIYRHMLIGSFSGVNALHYGNHECIVT